MARKSGCDLQIAALAAAQARHRQHPLFEHTQEDVVGFRTGAIELVVDKSVAMAAGGGEPVIHPYRAHVFLGLEH